VSEQSDKHDADFKIGDLVACVYDLFDHYDYILEDDSIVKPLFRGIIVEIHEEITPLACYDYERLYIVRCSDGALRYFAYWEIRLLSRSP
jgi:hypothetical protein